MDIDIETGVVEQLMYYPATASTPEFREWTFLCEAPCRVYVHPKSRLRVHGGPVRGGFRPISGSRTNYVYYDPGNPGARVGGGLLLGIGTAGFIGGFAMLVTALVLAADGNTEDAGGLALWGLLPFAGGIGMVSAGSYLAATQRPRIRVEIGGGRLSLRPRRLEIGAGGLRF